MLIGLISISVSSSGMDNVSDSDVPSEDLGMP